MPEDPVEVRKALLETYVPTDIIDGFCSQCSADDLERQLEIYQNKQVPSLLALYCPLCGALFFIGLPSLEESLLEPGESD